MGEDPRLPVRPASLEIAIEGEGLDLDDVNIRMLAQLLEATASTLDALAAEAGLQAVMPSLEAVRSGSAAYGLHSTEAPWREVVRKLRSVVKTRGAGSGHAVRHGLARMHQLGAKLGAVRISTSIDGPGDDGPLYLAAPLDHEDAQAEFTTELYGRIVGVNEHANQRTVIHLELVDGRRETLQADEALANRAIRLFRQKVRVLAAAVWREDRDANWTARSIEEWTDLDLLDTLEKIRDGLRGEGTDMDVDAWIRGLD